MRIQLALDRMTKRECKHFIRETSDFIDVIELGTGVIKEYGMSIVKEISELFPDKEIVADMKTCDAGYDETKQALNAGATTTTVMAFATNETIEKSLLAAEEFGGNIMIDLLGNPSTERINTIHNLGVDLFCLHHSIDLNKSASWVELDFLTFLQKENVINLALAGGITEEVLDTLNIRLLERVIIGSAITKSNNPRKSAENLQKIIKNKKK